MASPSLFLKRTFSSGSERGAVDDVIEEKKNESIPTSRPLDASSNRSVVEMRMEVENKVHSGGGIMDQTVMETGDGDHETIDNGNSADASGDVGAISPPPPAPSSDVDISNAHHPKLLWSTELSTPSDSSPFLTPSSDIHSLKHNLHGMALKHCFDRSKLLSRGGKNSSMLFGEIANLHDELCDRLGKLCPALESGILQQGIRNGGGGASMEHFGMDVGRCVSSFIDQTRVFGNGIRNDITRMYHENSAKLLEEGNAQYSEYTAGRVKCAQSRREAMKLRKKYVESLRELDGCIISLRKARAARARKRKTTESSNDSGFSTSTSNSKEDGEMDTSATGGGMTDATPADASSWEEELRQYGRENGLLKYCEGVIRASEEVTAAQDNYTRSVADENVAVDEVQDVERRVLDSLQSLEEERIVSLIGLFDKLLQAQKESLQKMSLDLTSTEPLDLFSSADGGNSNNEEHPMPRVTSAAPLTSGPALFMSPRRRAQSDDGPAINETRMLNLPDNIAEIRDNMKSLMGRQFGRLKTLKLVVAFNEGIASAIETFASNLKSQLVSNIGMNKSEGAHVLNAWKMTVASLEMYATNAELLAKQIREGNSELSKRLSSAEKEAKLLQEREEYRWKALCDAARVETKAKMKHKQCTVDLEKARTRLTLVEGEQGGVSFSSSLDSGVGGGAGGNEGDTTNNISGKSNSNISPVRSRAQTTMEKLRGVHESNLGKMFSVLPSGGAAEDALNKVLTPQQRHGIAQRQLDEAISKEEKTKESYEVASSVKSQAVVTYETDAESAEFKFKNDDRREWNMMHKSLICCVTAVKDFRDVQFKSVMSSIETFRDRYYSSKDGNTVNDALVLEDTKRWTEATEKRVKDQLARSIVDDTKPGEQDGAGGNGRQQQSVESGFSLKVQLVEDCTNVEEAVRRFLNDEDVMVDDIVEVGIDMSSSKEVNGDFIDSRNDIAPTPSSQLPDVPLDPHIHKMETIFSKKLTNVTIDRYYDVGWSEEIDPLYKPWLERKGSFDVHVGDWEQFTTEDGGVGGFENAWSGEKFPQKRIIRFKFRRTTHLYIGPPVAGVTQTQYLIKEGNDRCVVMMTVEMDGIPYADSFLVEVRWSARRVRERDIAVDAGVIVRFTKSNMFASKIKSGTLKETAPIHIDLFQVIKSALASGEEGMEGIGEDSALPADEEAEEAEAAAIETPTMSLIESTFRQVVDALSSLTLNQLLLLAFVALYFLSKIFFRRTEVPTTETVDNLTRKVDDLTLEVREMKAVLERILELSEKSSSNRRDEL